MRYRIVVRRTEINDYFVEAADEEEAKNLLMEGVEVNSVLSPEGCEGHKSRGHGIVDMVLDDDDDNEILEVEEVKEEEYK